MKVAYHFQGGNQGEEANFRENHLSHFGQAECYFAQKSGDKKSTMFVEWAEAVADHLKISECLKRKEKSKTRIEDPIRQTYHKWALPSVARECDLQTSESLKSL